MKKYSFQKRFNRVGVMLVPFGQTFMYKDKFFLRVRSDYAGKELVGVDLQNGALWTFNSDDKVYQVCIHISVNDELENLMKSYE